MCVGVCVCVCVCVCMCMCIWILLWSPALHVATVTSPVCFFVSQGNPEKALEVLDQLQQQSTLPKQVLLTMDLSHMTWEKVLCFSISDLFPGLSPPVPVGRKHNIDLFHCQETQYRPFSLAERRKHTIDSFRVGRNLFFLPPDATESPGTVS